MSTHDDPQHDADLARLRGEHASLSRQEPGPELDAAIRAAAERHTRQRNWPVWSAAAGLAACVGLAVVLVPVLLIEAPRNAAQLHTTETVLMAERSETERAVQQKHRETATMRESTAPPAPQILAEETTLVSAAQEKGIAREQPAPEMPEISKPVIDNDMREMPDSAKYADMDKSVEAPSSAADLDRVQVTGSRISPKHAERSDTHVDAIRAELADADEPAWRKRLLALREQGEETVAQALLKDYHERFNRPDTYTLDDLEQEPVSDEP